MGHVVHHLHRPNSLGDFPCVSHVFDDVPTPKNGEVVSIIVVGSTNFIAFLLSDRTSNFFSVQQIKYMEMNHIFNGSRNNSPFVLFEHEYHVMTYEQILVKKIDKHVL